MNDTYDAECEARRGLAYFHAEDYSNAAACYERAVAKVPANAQWRAMLESCRSNIAGGVNEFVPEVVHFKRHQVLAAPADPGLPPSHPDIKLPFQLHKLRYFRLFIGRTFGALGSAIINTATRRFGWDYKGPLWTDWYDHCWPKAILNLAYMRDELHEKNLVSTYPNNDQIGFLDKPQIQPIGVEKYRTADGTWNNLANPKEGAAQTRFMRNVDPSSIEPENDLLHPNPRMISLKLLTRGETMKEVPFLNLLAASWTQFQVHDWVSHGDNLLDQRIDIPLPPEDPARQKYGLDVMSVPRTQSDPSYRCDGKEPVPVSYLNEVTHWWDGSQLYGSDLETQRRLRSGVDGRMKLAADGRLPLHPQGTEDTGFRRNWWVGLAMLHTLFVREHNAICDCLKYYYPDWPDDRLFNVARLINAAVMAKIHSTEWTSAVLPNGFLNTALNSNWYGMLTYHFRSPRNRKTVAAFNIQNPELGGLVGNAIEKHGCPFGLSEEFAEVYRLHSLLPETLNFRNYENDEAIEHLPFVASRQAGSHKITEMIGMANLFYSFGNQHPGFLGLNNYPKFMQELSVPGNPFIDLAAVDILRARERGVPRYNEFRRQLNLDEIPCFEKLTDDPEQRAKLREVYEDDIEQLDLMVGTLAEAHRPTNFGFGETLFQIFILNASRRLQADRFYTTDFRDDVYTRQGMEWIDAATMKSVILRHFPELELTGLGNITNAFEPWDTDYRLSPERHPLRQYLPELKKNPWQGDAYKIAPYRRRRRRRPHRSVR